ncbi:MAG: hypothetical protein OEY97_02940 [Nitrospirota bacterium]|nr:hypothetical protein [Nitrospirota bacterium]
MNLLLACLGLGILGGAVWGYGVAVSRACGLEKPGPAFHAALGIAALGVAGGVLNAAALARPPVLWATLVVGLVLAAVHAAPSLRVWRSSPLRPGGTWIETILPGVLTLVTTLYFAATLLPSKTFNLHDDLHTYFDRAYRLLETGTLGGDRFELLGIDSLGTQSLFHAATLLFWPTEFLSGFDSVFCLMVVMLLAAELVRACGGKGWLAPAATFSVLAVNPVIVNTSSVYSSTVMILGATLAIQYAFTTTSGPLRVRALIPASLFLAVLPALKLTQAGFSTLFCALWFLVVFRFSRDRPSAVRLGLLPAGLGIAGLLPWALPVIPKYLVALGGRGAAEGASYLALPGTLRLIASPEALAWGVAPLSDLVLAALGLAAGVAAVVLLKSRPEETRGALAGLTLCGLSVTLAYLTNWLVFDPPHAVRYSAPFVMTAPVVALALLGLLMREGTLAPRAEHMLAAVTVILAAGVFPERSLAWRIELAAEYGTQVAHRVHPVYDVKYSQGALSPASRKMVRDMQEKTAPGAPIVVVMSVPFLLDHARNPVWVASQPSRVSHPWLPFPPEGGMRPTLDFLRGEGVRYVLWEVTGLGMRRRDSVAAMAQSDLPAQRRLGKHYLNWLDGLEEMGDAGYAVHRSGRMYLFDLDAVRPSPP